MIIQNTYMYFLKIPTHVYRLIWNANSSTLHVYVVPYIYIVSKYNIHIEVYITDIVKLGIGIEIIKSKSNLKLDSLKCKIAV